MQLALQIVYAGNLTKMPFPQNSTVSTSLINQLYIVGGWKPKYSKMVHKYNGVTDKWKRIADLKKTGYHPCVFLLGNTLYYVSWKQVEKLNIEDSNAAWEDGPSLPHLADLSSCAVLNDIVYVTGNRYHKSS